MYQTAEKKSKLFTHCLRYGNATIYPLMVIKWSAAVCREALHLHEVYFTANNHFFRILNPFLLTLLQGSVHQCRKKKSRCNFTSSPRVFSKSLKKSFFFPLCWSSIALNLI